MTIACADCGTLQDLTIPTDGFRAVCRICANCLELRSGRSITASLACALGTFLLLFPANLLPLMSVSMLHMQQSSKLASGVFALWHEHFGLLAILIGLFAIVLPFVRFGCLSLAL